MKRISLLFITCSFAAVANAQFGGFLNKVQNKVADRASDNVANQVDNSMNKKSAPANNTAAQDTTKTDTQQGNTAANTTSTAASASDANKAIPAKTDSTLVYKAYSNYDFVPGDTIIFADDFTDDQDGEFPSHWNLDAGQGILNMVGKDEAFALTQGNYVTVSPRMKNDNKAYLTSGFTIELNYYATDGYGPMLRFKSGKNDECGDVHFSNDGGVSTSYFPKDFSAPFPADTKGFRKKWHHAAFIFKNGTIKCYVDQYRILVMPNVVFAPGWVQFGGIGDPTNPILFKDVRIASGGNMNSIGKKFTDAKIITHGINFDVDKSTLKPESMGTLNMIVKIMNNNPDLKFEVDGHTDNSGAAKHNMDLSQQRADAVKAQLVSLGIDPSRLSTKGFGDTKPISTNDTQEGKANNRRVEFVKM